MAGHREDPLDLLILGVHLKDEGYPNVRYRVEELLNRPDLAAREINVPMWTPSTQRRKGWLRLFRNPLRALTSHTRVLFRYLRLSVPANVYIPYPAIFLQLLLSLLPSRFRPRHTVLDLFISLYDTVVVDRRLLRQGSLPARLLYRLERRALLAADALVVDTEENRQYLAELFRIPLARFHAIPLSTNEEAYRETPYHPSKEGCQVLFVGTLIPLHGVEVIVEAMQRLAPHPNIRFHVIGTGQEGHFLEAYLQTAPANLTWTQSWQGASRLAEAIQGADICLGLFGTTAKTERVCPLKIYAYSGCGRAILTGRTEWVRSLGAEAETAFELVPTGDAEALAEGIVRLSQSPSRRQERARASGAFYRSHLTNRDAIDQLVRLLRQERITAYPQR